eukprot:403361848
MYELRRGNHESKKIVQISNKQLEFKKLANQTAIAKFGDRYFLEFLNRQCLTTLDTIQWPKLPIIQQYLQQSI